MHIGVLRAAILLLTLNLLQLNSAHGATPEFRWLSSDSTLRREPHEYASATARLQQGTQVVLKQRLPKASFCLIESLLHYGYVACESLSIESVPLARAGEAGVPGDTRWVTGSTVLLRNEPRTLGQIVGRIGFNRPVRLLAADEPQDYCEIDSKDAGRGFVACRYLALSPVDESKLLSKYDWSGELNPDYDPQRAFWIAPGWERMENYAQVLAERHQHAPADQRWPRDAELEKMKAELAKGMYAPAPAALPDWQEMQEQLQAISNTSGQPPAATAGNPSSWPPAGLNLAQGWESQLGLWNAPERSLALVSVLRLPAAAPSWFKTEHELAPPESAQALSGRFRILYRWQTTPRPALQAGEYHGTAGLYDMLGRSQSLLRPVPRVVLYRDGRLDVDMSNARSSETLSREVDPEMCSDWLPGFAYGAADPSIWDYLTEGYPDEQVRAVQRQRPGSIYQFHVQTALPRSRALLSLREYPMDRSTTGFVRATELSYDLDHDGHADLLVWEGKGRGPGHLDGETLTDDSWYRLVLANIGGRWKVLGFDRFGYGCGC